MIDIKFPITLPSGGLFYPPFGYVRYLTNELSFLDIDMTPLISMFHYYVILVSNFTETSVDVNDLYLKDFYYLYQYLQMINGEQAYLEITHDVCVECEHKNNIRVDLGNLKYSIYDKFSESKIQKTYTYKINNITIVFRNRKVSDNFELSNARASIIKSNDTLSIITYFLLSQIISVSVDDQIIPQDEYFDFLIFQRLEVIYSIYYYFIEQEHGFGLNDNFQYSCKKCQTINVASLYNNIAITSFISDKKIIREFQTNFIKGILFNSSTNILSVQDSLKIPKKYNQTLDEILSHTKFTMAISPVIK